MTSPPKSQEAVPVAVTGATDRPPVLDDRALLGHPRGLGLLFVVEMWERFSYYGMRALLILYLVNAIAWSDGDAARLYGQYTALVYLTQVIGGYVADRWLGTRNSLVVGAIIISLGHFSMAFGPNPVAPGAGRPEFAEMMPFYAGLLLIIIGTGFFKPNVSTMVGQIYPEGDARRDAGFTIFYMGINLGAFLAPLVTGYLAQTPGYGWHWGFSAAGVGMVIGLIIYLWGRDRYLPGIGLGRARERGHPGQVAARGVEEARDRGTPIHGIVGAASGALIAFAMDAGWVGYLMGTIIGASLTITILGTTGDERKRVIAIFLVVFFVIFFWMAFEQAGSSMNLFADRYTDLTVGGYELRSSWFQSVNALFILMFAPVFAILWSRLGRARREPSTALKMVLGLFLLGVGFLFLVLGARGVDACITQVGVDQARTLGTCAIASPMWLVLAYLFHTWGELCLSPVGLSYVTKVAPIKFASLLMGVWFLANAAANYLGGLLAAMTEDIPRQSTFFTIPVATSIGAAILLLMLVPVLKRLTAGVRGA